MSVSAPNAAQSALAMYKEGYNCAQSVLASCGEPLGISHELAIRVAQAFGGGMGTGATCGAVTGAFMAIGFKCAKKSANDEESKAKAHKMVAEFSRRFKQRNRSILCNDLLGVDLGTAEGRRQAQSIGLFKTLCPKFVADAAEICQEVIASA